LFLVLQLFQDARVIPIASSCSPIKTSPALSLRSSSASSSLCARATILNRGAIVRAGSTRPNISGFSAIEISAPASNRLCPSAGNRCNPTPRLASMNENSPICARLADTVNAV
jgi:hypothetical protein